MNTARLRTSHPGEYRSFFGRFDLVVSAPVIGRYPSLGLYQKNASYAVPEKYPLRNYFGYSQGAPTGEISFKRFVPADGAFEEEPISKSYPISSGQLAKMGLVGETGVLSEYNWTDIPSVASCAAALACLVAGKISPEELAGLRLEKDGCVPVAFKKMLAADRASLHDSGFLSEHRNSSDFIGCSALGYEAHVACLGPEKFVTIGPEARFESADYSSFLLDPHLFTEPFFQSAHIFHREEELRSKFADRGLPDAAKKYALDTESLGNCHILEIFTLLQDVYAAKGATGLHRALSQFSKYRMGIFHDTVGRQVDTECVARVLRSHCEKDADFSVVQAGRRVQVFGTRNFDISLDAVEALKRHTGIAFTLDYSSHMDGWEKEGVVLEQWASRNIFPSYAAPYGMDSFVPGKAPTRSYANHDWSWRNLCPDGVVVDAVNGKIYIGDAPVGSDEIKTQSATAQILSSLSRSQEGAITSKALRVSAYASDRSEFVSKIASPLRSIVKERLGKNLHLTCQNLEVGFSISWGDLEVPVIIIRPR